MLCGTRLFALAAFYERKPAFLLLICVQSVRICGSFFIDVALSNQSGRICSSRPS